MRFIQAIAITLILFVVCSRVAPRLKVKLIARGLKEGVFTTRLRTLSFLLL